MVPTWASAEFCRTHPERFNVRILFPLQANTTKQPSPSVHVSAPAPSHTPAPFMCPSLRYPPTKPTSPTTTLFSPPSPTAPPQLYPPNVPKKKVGRAQQGRREGCGQQLVIDRRVGSRLVVNGRKMEGRGGAGRGSATWFEVARQSKGKRWVKWDRGGGGGGVRDGGREQEEKAGGKSR
jgi:hypothetical protein